MMKPDIIGRDAEIEMLENCVSSKRSEFVVVYGRRRVGKTYLVNQVFKERFNFRYVGGHHLSEEEQLQNFATALVEYGRLSFVPLLKNWLDAFSLLQKILGSSRSKKKIVFIDEMPW
ncbi:MAG: ATP-binding protein, partial [Fibrobacter sp.]|nr:ATP-binding protein [Fibrobacter sp.]